jgi:hypothetical protein
MTTPPDLGTPLGFLVKPPLRFLLVVPIRAQGMTMASSRADVLSRYLPFLL